MILIDKRCIIYSSNLAENLCWMNPNCSNYQHCQREVEREMNESNQQDRNGSPQFYKLTKEMEDTHDRKSHDYASNSDPFANYKFAGMMSKLFDNSEDAGFIGRIGEKLYRLANLENNAKSAKNESIEDTEIDIATIVALWIAMRRERRARLLESIKL